MMELGERELGELAARDHELREPEVFVRTPRRGGLTRLLTDMGATVHAEPGGLSVSGMGASDIAQVAATRRIPILELTTRRVILDWPPAEYPGVTSDVAHVGDSNRR